MSAAAAESAGVRGELPTVWGLSPVQVHDRFWAARGVQVVRRGEPSEVIEGAELFLLVPADTLVAFRLGALIDTLSWLRPRVSFLRIRDRRERGYREELRADADGSFLELRRIYGAADTRLARVALTTETSLAEAWRAAAGDREAWTTLRARTARGERICRRVVGQVDDRSDDREAMEALTHLVATWAQPAATVPAVVRVARGVWAHESSRVSPQARFLGPAWVGAGRSIAETACVTGPAVLWDDPAHRPEALALRWDEIEPSRILLDRSIQPRRVGAGGLAVKRIFDVLFSLLALALTLPLYPFVVLAILIEDGWPVFFAHRRETRGGREFGCLKFRSMRKDAEQIKRELKVENLADGPQFYFENDPRLTRVGRFLRKFQLDELPQFWNVLLGHMSVVGPRPSPREENQYCPAWREARLSVRPGVTGLWQVERTRSRGQDFQEWIRYDIEYVERRSFRMDLRIIGKTVLHLFGKR